MLKWLLKPSTLVGAAVVTVVAWGAYMMSHDTFMDQNGGRWSITPPTQQGGQWHAKCLNWQTVYGKLPTPIDSAVGDTREQLIATIQEGAAAAAPFLGA